MALSRLKVAARLVLAVGMTATVGWVGTHRDIWFPHAPVRVASQPKGQAQPLGNPAAPVPKELTPEPPRGNPAVPVLASRQASPPPAKASQDVARTSPVAKEEKPTVERRQVEAPKPVADLVPVAPNPREARALGAVLFAKEWVPNDPMSHGGDGLGPVYNESSCMACHGLGAPGGAGPESKNVVLVTATPTRPQVKGLDKVHPGFRGGRSVVLHRFGTDPKYGTWRRDFYASNRDDKSNGAPRSNESPVEARIRVLQEETAVERRLHDRALRLRGTADFTLTLSERNAPPLFGAGRIDAIPSYVLVAQAERQPKNIRGRVNRTREGRIGRFGWKSQVASLHEFVRAACANELGLEVPGHSQATSPVSPDHRAKGLDLTEPECDALVSYIRALPSPVVIDPAGPEGSQDMREGRKVFVDVGCATCHTPTLGSVRGIYSDLLLHDMGQSLSDSGTYYGFEDPGSLSGPNPREWRTPPLWGFRDSGPYLHDGRAQTLEEAVALHEGQAKASAIRFFERTPWERSQVEAFLKSLVAPSAAASPGVVLASDMESRFERDDRKKSEMLVRQSREEADARDQKQWEETRRRRLAEEAANRARIKWPAAQDLEKMGKVVAALKFYREIAREAPDSEEGRQAASRIASLSAGTESP